LLSSYVLPRFGWRPLFWCAIVPGMLALLLFRGLPDPPAWAASAPARSGRDGGFSGLWSDRAARRNAVLWTLTSIALQFGYYGANTWLPSYLAKDLGVSLQNTGWYVAGGYAMACVGKVVTGYAADSVGRRTMWLATGVMTAVYLPLLIVYGTPSTIMYLLLGFGLLYAAPYAVNGTYMAESFPVAVRGTAVGTAYNVGRIGSTLSPVLIGYVATQYSIGFGLALLGISYLICALLPGLFIAERQFDPSAAPVLIGTMSSAARPA
jgi:AAHS family cis,cis-muconate transporter-like MFS transporter